MFGSSVTLCPLRKVEESHLKKLCRVLWDWEFCDQCKNEKPCWTSTCPWGQRSRNLKPFFDFYRNATAWSIPEVPAGGQYALRSHDDLFNIIELLRKRPGVARSVLTEEHFSTYTCRPDKTDQQRAFNLAIKIMMMLNCSIKNQGLDVLELGSGPTIWGNHKSQQELLESNFPVKEHHILDENGGPSDIKRRLNALNLKKKARVKFQGTADLKNHLKLDHNTGIVQIYHHTTFLKEHLLATREMPKSDSIPREIITRQLALETIDSIQKILFPFGHDARQLLRTLALQNAFDPDCFKIRHLDYRRDDEKEILYHHWGSRLMDLYDELRDPSPRGIFHWLQVRSKGRHVMMATIAGVIFALVLGLLTLAVGIFQAWVSYQQWKHPVNIGS